VDARVQFIRHRDAAEGGHSSETPVTFTNSRWLKPIERFRDAPYLYSPKAAQYTPDGLRGTGILARAEQGYEVDQIANDIGMSRRNLEHYMRFRDQMKVGADRQKRLRLVNKED
jgi:hypothetical protein